MAHSFGLPVSGSSLRNRQPDRCMLRSWQFCSALWDRLDLPQRAQGNQQFPRNSADRSQRSWWNK